MPPDPGAMIRQLRPPNRAFDPDSPTARASLERILAAPPLPPHRRWFTHSAARRLALGCAVAALTMSALALRPLLGSSPDVVARAAAALAQPGTILHLRAEVRARESA